MNWRLQNLHINCFFVLGPLPVVFCLFDILLPVEDVELFVDLALDELEGCGDRGA